MLVSELNFPHVMAEREARLTRELEQRRVVLERLAEDEPAMTVPAATPRRRWWRKPTAARAGRVDIQNVSA